MLGSEQVVEFRSLWGEKSELRRFEDGSINEAVLWVRQGAGSRDGMQARKLVCCEIIRHLMHRSEPRNLLRKDSAISECFLFSGISQFLWRVCAQISPVLTLSYTGLPTPVLGKGEEAEVVTVKKSGC